MILTGRRAKPLSDVSMEIFNVSKQSDAFPFKINANFCKRSFAGSVILKKFESQSSKRPGVAFWYELTKGKTHLRQTKKNNMEVHITKLTTHNLFFHRLSFSRM